MTKKIRMTATRVYEYEVDLDDEGYAMGNDGAWTDPDGIVHDYLEPGSVDTLEKAIEIDRYYLYEVGTIEEEIAGMAKSITHKFEIIEEEQ